jgi:hypothetical protein
MTPTRRSDGVGVALLGAILSLMPACAHVPAWGHDSEASHSECRLRMKDLGLGLKYYSVLEGRFPQSLDEYRSEFAVPPQAIECPFDQRLFLYNPPPTDAPPDSVILSCPTHTNNTCRFSAFGAGTKTDPKTSAP